jgi:replicative DNA helicase
MNHDDDFPSGPPHHIESEQAIFGGLLLDNNAWDHVSDKVSEADFFTADHRKIVRAISEILNRNKPLDLVTLAERLESLNQLEEVGGISYLGELVRNTPSAANIQRYAEIVREKSLLRTMAVLADDIRKQVMNPNGKSAKELLDMAQSRFMTVGDGVAKQHSSMESMTTVLPKLMDTIQENFEREGDDSVIGLRTGLDDLDNLLLGLQDGDLIILAGRPSMGKTALALNIGRHVSLNQRKNVLVFTFEMSNKQLANRVLSDVSGIHSQRLITGRMNDDEWDRVMYGVSQMHDIPMFMDEDGGLTVGDIKARARRLHRECGGLKLIIIDYLQMIASSNSDSNRANVISEITRELKRLAKELNVPVIAISQLSRSVESRPDKRPIMSDLRESGAIEQDADVIAFVYRDEYYHQDSEYKGEAEIIIAKQRNGPIDTVRTNFVKHLTRFENYVHMNDEREQDYAA